MRTVMAMANPQNPTEQISRFTRSLISAIAMLTYLNEIASAIFTDDLFGSLKLIMTFFAFVLFANYIRWLMR